MPSSTRERIAIIGPVPPYRGGIAQHTMMLSRALMPRADVLVLSFTRQYPGWLYPGSGDIEPGAARMTQPECRYLLDSLNPLSWERTVKSIAEFGASIAVIPWWSAFWAPCAAYLTHRLSRLGIPVHFHCHNVAGHDASRMEHAFARLALRGGSTFRVHSEAERAELLRLLPSARVGISAHPVYFQYPDPLETLPRRAAVELLFFGFVRRYKGLDILLESLRGIRDRDFMLTIAGEIWDDRTGIESLAATPGLSGRLEIIDRYVGAQEASMLFDRADALVMPYRSATGSGVLGLAYRYGIPVIASALPGIAEHVRDGETGWLVQPGSVEDLARTLEGVSAERAKSMKPAIEAFARTLTWEALAASLIEQAASTPAERR